MSTTTSPSEISVASPFDAHVHLRQGDMCSLIGPHVAQGGVHTAYVMPNLVPPISTTDEAVAYHGRLKAIAPSTRFLMSLYLSPALTPEEVRKAKESGVIWGVKSYPRGVTTNSASGVESYDVYYPVFQAMEEVGLVLNLHGEVPSDTDKSICVLNAEALFLEHLHKLHASFPKLRIILEHATTRAAVEAVKACGPTVGCTITPHHLQLTVDDWAGKPLNFCKPVAKYPDDRAALREIIKEGHPRFFLGSDSAPHPLASKMPSAATHGLETVTSCGCAAGVYTSATLLPLCAHLLESFGALDKLEGYVSSNGRAFYGLDTDERQPGGSVPKSTRVTLQRTGAEAAKVPTAYIHPDHQALAEGDKDRIQVVPFMAGQQLNWAIASTFGKTVQFLTSSCRRSNVVYVSGSHGRRFNRSRHRLYAIELIDSASLFLTITYQLTSPTLYMSNRPDLNDAQGTRPPFDGNAGFVRTQPPAPEWKPGQGRNDVPLSQSHFNAERPMRVVDPKADDVSAGEVYKLMCGGIAPRPVALVGTLNEEGVPNLAPISWYQMVSHDPPLVMICFGGPGGNRKDSEKNIKARKEFTISSSSEPYVEALNYASIDAPRGTSEFTLVGLTPEPSLTIAPPRVKEAPFAMECTLELVQDWNNDAGVHTTSMVVGRVSRLLIRDHCIDASTGSLDPARTLPVSRFGGLLFARSTVGYELVRPKYEEVREQEEVKARLEEARKPWERTGA